MTKEIKMNMPIKRFTLDRKQPVRPLLQIKGIIVKSFLTLKMDNPFLHIKSFFSTEVTFLYV